MHLKKAVFPFVMTVLSLLGFLSLYWWINVISISYKFLSGLVFSIPFFTYLFLTFLTLKLKIKAKAANILIAVLIPVFAITMLFALLFLSIKEATTITTDPNKYERVLKLTHYPQNEITKHFPESIPEIAEDVKFSYNPQFLQGGENFTLGFKADVSYVKDMIQEYQSSCQFIGNAAEDLEAYGFFSHPTNRYFEDSNIPASFDVYVIDSKPDHPDDFNHGMKYGFLVSQSRDEIVYFADSW